MMSRVSLTLSVVWVSRRGALDRRPDLARLGDAADEVHAAVDLSQRAFHLGMAAVADEDHVEPASGEAASLRVHPCDQRTGGVDHLELPRRRVRLHLAGDAVRGEHGHRSERDLLDVLDEDGAALAQVGDHALVVDDLVADVDRRAEPLERPLDDLDGALDAGAEPSRVCEQDFHGEPDLPCVRWVRSLHVEPSARPRQPSRPAARRSPSRRGGVVTRTQQRGRARS